MSRDEDTLVVCEQCGLLHRWHAVVPGETAHCLRCEAVLGRGHRRPIVNILALTVASAAAFAVAMSSRLMTISLRGGDQSATLPQTILSAWSQGEVIVATVALLTALVAPALFIALRLYILVPLTLGRKPPGLSWSIRLLHQAARWNMMEVFTVGVLLSLVRLAGLADATPGPGLYAIGSMTLLFAAIESAGLKHLWWQLP